MFIDGDDLEAIAYIFPARIGNREDPDMLVTGTEIGNSDAKLFQAAFQRFDSEILFVQHGCFSFLCSRVSLIDRYGLIG
jgi:hypothetical protein